MKTKFSSLTLQEQIDLIQSLGRGTFHCVTYRKRVSLAAKYGDVIVETESVIGGRFGIDYDHIAKVIEKRESGEMAVGVLKGFTTLVKDLCYTSDKTGEVMFRFTPFDGAKHSKKFFENGKEVSLDYLLSKYPKSAFIRSGEAPLVLSLYAKNILSIA